MDRYYVICVLMAQFSCCNFSLNVNNTASYYPIINAIITRVIQLKYKKQIKHWAAFAKTLHVYIITLPIDTVSMHITKKTLSACHIIQ